MSIRGPVEDRNVLDPEDFDLLKSFGELQQANVTYNGNQFLVSIWYDFDCIYTCVTPLSNDFFLGFTCDKNTGELYGLDKASKSDVSAFINGAKVFKGKSK